MNIRPISDLRNYNQVLQEVTNEQLLFLTKNGRSKYAIIDIEDYGKLKASLEIIESMKKAGTSGTIDIDVAKEKCGIL